MSWARQAVKHLAEWLLCTVAVPTMFRRLHRADALILAYHNIVPEGSAAVGDASLHLAQRDFAAQLDVLRRTHDVVPLEAVLERRAGRGRPRAVITFDDAYRGAMSAGVEELARRRMPATVFVAPAFVDGGTFWWDVVRDDSGRLGAATRTRALVELAGRDGAVRAWWEAQGGSAHRPPAHQTCASEAELRAAQGESIAVGSHTWSHANLAALPPDELEEELVRPRQWLTERFTRVVDWVAYPYGLYSPAVTAAAQAAGYAAALRVDGGWLRSGAGERYALPRQNVPAGMSVRGFELRVSGVT